jgi:hypothetical protein
MGKEKPAKRPVGQPPKPPEIRKRNKTFRLAPEAIQQIHELSERLATTETAVIEQVIREAHQKD